MAGPFTTPVSFSVPFESEPERNNGFVSKNAQEAIEEALGQAIANDRFLVLSYYNGNANTGRFTEFFPGIDCDDAPLIFTTESRVVQITCATTSNNSNATIGFYDQANDPTYSTPLYTLDMNNQKEKIDDGGLLFTIPDGGRLVVKVDSASIQKPHLQIVFSSTI